MRRESLSLLTVGMLAVAGACGDADAPGADDTQRVGTVQTPAEQAGHSPAEQTYAPELDVNLDRMQRTPSGLYTQDLVEGTGQTAQAGNLVVAHYTGWLPNGQEFDSSRGGQPFEFPLGQGRVIPGWDEGVAGMREGGRRRLVIPSELAYGPQGAGGVIPPNATLVFDIELLEVR
jgi:FKBP-type peptidyl-prolyl cis-trans isomerase FkpA